MEIEWNFCLLQSTFINNRVYYFFVGFAYYCHEESKINDEEKKETVFGNE